MHATAPSENGRARRSLNDSITRLDRMIDGLAEAIPGTIRDVLQEAVTAAVAEGVRAALTEVLSSPAIVSRLTSRRPSRAKVLLAQGKAMAATAARWAGSALRRLWARTKVGVGSAARRLRGLKIVWNARRPMLIAFGVGLMVTAVCLVAPNWVAAVVSGVGAAIASAAVQAGLWVRRTLVSLALA